MTQPDTDVPDIGTRAAAGEASREQVVDGIYTLLPDVLQRDLAGLSEQTGLKAELGMESTVALELILRLEELLGVEVSVETLDREHLATIGSLAGYVTANLLAEDED
ncbi:MAG TPA: phosphopantetheine-binding protein [Actinocrinis sp.]|jgi:acyl carrier protein